MEYFMPDVSENPTAPADAPPETPPPETAAPVLDDAEMARRVASIARRQRSLSKSQARFEAEKKESAPAIERIRAFERDSADEVKRDPIGFLNRTLGVSPQQIVDQLIGIQNRRPTDAAHDEARAATARIESLERQIAQGREQNAQRQAADYVQTTVAPLVSDKTKYRFLNHKHGSDAAATVYNTMLENYNRTGTARTPQEVADFIEKTYRDQANADVKLLGVSTSPAPQKPAAPAAPMIGRRHIGKSYSTRVR
jgi:hypothetical protein